MSQLQQSQFPIDQAIYAEVLDCIPASWNRARLIADFSDDPAGGGSISIRIDGQGQAGIALVSDPLRDRVRELMRLNRQFQTGLRGIEYSYTQQPDGRWSFVGDYKYG